MVVCSSRISTLDSTSILADIVSNSTKIKFWAFQVLCEWIAAVLVLSVDVRRWFSVEGSVISLNGNDEENIKMRKFADYGV